MRRIPQKRVLSLLGPSPVLEYPNAPPEIPEWFPEFLEVIASLRFGDSDQIQLITPQPSLEVRRCIRTMSEDEPYLKWATSYLAR